jgi:hypothetical protein
MTKKMFHYLVVQAGGCVSLIRTTGIQTAQTMVSLKDMPRHDYVDVNDRALLVLHSNSIKGRRSTQATDLHIFGVKEGATKQEWVLWHNYVVI